MSQPTGPLDAAATCGADAAYVGVTRATVAPVTARARADRAASRDRRVRRIKVTLPDAGDRRSGKRLPERVSFCAFLTSIDRTVVSIHEQRQVVACAITGAPFLTPPTPTPSVR